MNRSRHRSRRAWLLGVVVLTALGVAVVAMFRETLRRREGLSASVAGTRREQEPRAAGEAASQLVVPDVAAGADAVKGQTLVQGVVIDPCGAGLFSMPGPFVFTQSYTLLF